MYPELFRNLPEPFISSSTPNTTHPMGGRRRQAKASTSKTRQNVERLQKERSSSWRRRRGILWKPLFETSGSPIKDHWPRSCGHYRHVIKSFRGKYRRRVTHRRRQSSDAEKDAWRPPARRAPVSPFPPKRHFKQKVQGSDYRSLGRIHIISRQRQMTAPYMLSVLRNDDTIKNKTGKGYIYCLQMHRGYLMTPFLGGLHG